MFKPVGSLKDDKDQSIKTKEFKSMFESNEMDLYHVPRFLDESKIFLDRYNVEISKSIGSDSYRVGQMLDEPTGSDKLDFSSFFMENLNLIIIIFIGYLFSIISVLFFAKILKKSSLNYYHLLVLDLENLIDEKSRFIFAFILSAYFLFLFFTLNLLTNMIKTDSVILDTQKFIDSNDKLNTSHQKLLLVHIESELFERKQTSKFLNDLYERKQRLGEIVEKDDIAKKNITYLDRLVEVAENSDDYFWFLNKSQFIVVMNIFSNIAREKILFLNPTSYYDVHSVLYYSKKLKSSLKKIINYR